MSDNTTPAGEFDYIPVTTDRLLPARHFAASYAGEHVAGTEFVIGAMFVAWGVSTGAVIGGLILGNLLAVLSWALICAPIATDTRLTLYAYLEKIAGKGIIRIYSVINGVFFCVLGGAMITVSASAVRILFNIDPQIHWYPSSTAFVLVALVVGGVVVTVAVRGFAIVARFAQICAPWMILMFAAGALAMWPVLAAQANLPADMGYVEALWSVGDAYIWVENPQSTMSFWHVAAFAWICNLPMHVGLSDMTVLRFARRSSYGYFSVLGMFIGHFGAWIFAGVMGAGAASLLQTGIENLDAGAVAYQALGAAGIIAVIIAGWTTSNPTIYRAGLAFQSLNPAWNRTRVTVITGVITTVIACFPFVFSKLMDFLGFMGLLLAPIGAVIVAEHWLLPKLGLQRYWSAYRGQLINRGALYAWLAGLGVAFVANQLGLHLFFLLVPAWVTAILVYVVAARAMGAGAPFGDQALADRAAEEKRKQLETVELVSLQQQRRPQAFAWSARVARALAWGSLLVCAVMAMATVGGMELETLRNWLIVPSLVYFLSATYWINAKEKGAAK